MAKEFNIASPDPQDERLQALKSAFPDLFTEDGKIDFNRILGTLTEKKFTNIPEKEKLKRGERYQLDFAGKQEAYEKLNEPSIESLLPDASMSVNFNETENVIIEGDNLDALKILQHNYYGKVKCIYIDPPYNTGNDWFIYPDDYKDTRKKHLKKTGEMDSLGNLITDDRWRENNRTSGSFHSNWLGMMLPRLHLAKKLLKRDGVIFISIDDNEVHNLRMMMNEIFGEENFIANICVKSRASVSNDKIISANHNYILVYANNYEIVFENRALFGHKQSEEGFDKQDEKGKYKLVPVSAPGGSKKGNPYYEFLGVSGYFRFGKDKMGDMYKQGLIVKTGNTLNQKYYFEKAEKTRKTDTTWWDGNSYYNASATQRLNEVLSGDFFQNPKPVELVKRVIDLYTSSNDIILDFFAGSGTTAQAVMELNTEDNGKRSFILVQFKEEVKKDNDAYRSGYRFISEITCERVRRAGKQIADKQANSLGFDKKTDVGFRFFRVIDSNFEHWDSSVTESEIVQRTLDFATPEKADATDEGLLWEIILKTNKPLTTRVEEVFLKTGVCYSINHHEIIICIKPINEDLLHEIIAIKPKKLFCLDRLFAGNDQWLTNLRLLCEDAGIDFEIPNR